MKMNSKKISGSFLAVLLAALMIVTLIPITALADGSQADGEYVYLSISFDGKYIDDKNGEPIVYLPIALYRTYNIRF